MSPRGRVTRLPRYVKPESLVPGDLIRVRYPESGGVSVLKEGRVGEVVARGAQRHVMTAEGTILFVWGFDVQGEYTVPRVTLLEEGSVQQPELDLQL